MTSRPPKLQVTGGALLRNVSSYSIEEDATPISLSDQTGGAGQSTITVGVDGRVDGKALHRMKAVLSEDGDGTTSGTISNPSGDGVNLTLPLTSDLNALSVTRSVPPFSGTLTAYFESVFALVGVGNYSIDSSFNSVTVAFAGWDGDVRTNLWALCAVYGAEVSLVASTVTVRPVRQRVATNKRDASVQWAIADSSLVQQVSGYWYDTSSITSGLIYPPGGWNSSVQVLQVAAGQTAETDLALTPQSTDGQGFGVSVTSIVAPTCVFSVGPTDDSASVYTVSGDDGLPVTPAEWKAGGGSLTVTVNPDLASLHVVLVGATGIPNSSGAAIQTYSIAMSSDTSDNYSSLRIIGSGAQYNKHLITYLTGLSVDMAPNVAATTIDTPFITDPATLTSRMTWVLSEAMGPTQTIGVHARAINRVSDTGVPVQPTVNDWDTHYSGFTVTQIDTDNSGLTWDQVDDKAAGWVSSTFENQMFGNLAGARVTVDGATYRISTATASGGQSGSGVQYTAQFDTTLDDLDAWFAGLTVDQIDALYDGATLNQQGVRPLVPLS